MKKSDDSNKAWLLLEDGTFMEGYSVGKPGTSGAEMCFNTGMTGYQEIYTDPSYFGQIIINTTSHIGNYGAFDQEQESDSPKISGIVVNEFSQNFSRITATSSLDEYLKNAGITGIAGVDTRKLVRHIRSKGAMNGIISSEISDIKELKAELDKIPSMEGLELSSEVSTNAPYELGGEHTEYKVAVLDLGIKQSILKNLNERGFHLKVYPAKSSFQDIASWNPDGFFLSNGPGDPAAMDYAVQTATLMQETGKPLFGICLGHQILALANGATTYKMHHGHRGINHPVSNLQTGKGEITSQNHGFAVSEDSLKGTDNLEITHINLNDRSIEGVKVKGQNAFSVQYHPESSPGPHDSRYLFDHFLTYFINQ